MIRTLLIANRGEIAVRIVRACRESGVESIAVFSDADARSRHVLLADRSIRLGPAPAAESYLSIPRVIAAAREGGADAIHPGYGFLSENAAFADACVTAGLIFVGPPAAAIARMGSKIEARRRVAAAGVPVVPGETPEDQTDAGIQRAVERVGLPALVKASAGGGGKGMRQVAATASPGEIVEAIQFARREASAAFGDGTLYVERLIERPRHVEVQVFADNHGHVAHLFERECSVQRRHQKVIEESPSPILSPGLRDRMTAAAVAATRAAEYRNAGTIEFLVDPPRDAFYFLEMNTRLQVEHPVTELVTGLDLVRAQLLVASGEPLPWTQDEITQRGHAIEARVYAEDPAAGFLPQAGRLERYREPQRPGIRVDAGVAEGGEVPVYYDPMIAKVIATAETRPLAIARLSAALREFEIGGIRTNIGFLLTILALPAFRDGTVDTAFLDREGAALAQVSSPPTIESPGKSAIRNPRSAMSIADPWDPRSVAVSARANVEPARRAARSHGSSALIAPMPATVVKVEVKPGDAVKKGDIVVLLEAMKMELPLRATADGVVKTVSCREGELVQADATLVEFGVKRVSIVEVGPRDGLQNEKVLISTADKIAFIDALSAAGLPVIEVSAFVSPKWVPQMADAAEVFAGITRRIGTRYSALVPNLAGLDRALQAGVSEIAIFASSTETFSRKNINQSIDESMATYAQVCERAFAAGLRVRGYLSTAFGCPFEGEVAPEQVAGVAERLASLGVFEVAISDTIGIATPGLVPRVLDAVLARLPKERVALHFHDTRGMALANVLTALPYGIATFDASAGGLGGCPYAPGAAGNLATDDLIYMLDGMGIETGVSPAALAAATTFISSRLDHPLASRLAQTRRSGV